VVNGVRNWGTGFMPAVYQGVEFAPEGVPIKYLDNPKGVSSEQQRDKLDLLAAFNRTYGESRTDNSELEARIRGYELAFRMQAEAPGAVDPGQETAATNQLYGMDQKKLPPSAATVCSRGGSSKAACASCSFIAGRAASGTATKKSRRITLASAVPSINPS